MSYAQDSGSKSASKSSSKKSKSSKSHKKSSSKEKHKKAAETATEPAIPPEEIIKFSDEQIMLNNQAVDAGNAGDYKKAEQLLMAMLQGGEMNIIWGNLGSLYAKQGKCIEAKDAFERVWTSPKISEIPAETIEQSAAQALEKLKAQCSANVIIKCSPADMKLTFDDGNEFTCSSEPLAVTPGKHYVLGKTNYGFGSIEALAVEGETRTYNIEILDYERIATDAGVSPEKLNKRSKAFKGVGYSFIGIGAAAGIASGVLMWYADKQNTDAIKKNRQAPNEATQNAAKKQYDDSKVMLNASYGVVAASGALLVTGIILVVYDALVIQPRIQEFEKNKTDFSWTVSPAVSTEFAGMAFSAQF